MIVKVLAFSVDRWRNRVQIANAFVDTLRFRIDEIKDKDKEWKEIVKKERKRRTVKVDSDLGNFIE